MKSRTVKLCPWLPLALIAAGCASVPQAGSEAPIPFDAKKNMVSPILISGQDPIYTKEALTAHSQGMVIAKCVLTTEGTVKDCRIEQSVPHMDDAVVTALQSRRYKPVLYEGRAVNVDYAFNVLVIAPSASLVSATDATDGGLVAPEEVQFGEGMTRPTLVSGPSSIALPVSKDQVQGEMVVKCVITTEGAVQNCRFVSNRLPSMWRSVLSALYSRHYTPVISDGHPIRVEYTFKIKGQHPADFGPDAGEPASVIL